MTRNQTLQLVNKNYTQDEIGNTLAQEELETVMCSVASVSGSEWTDAGRIGIKPDFVFILERHSYNGQADVVYEGVRYRVYRTYITGRQIELHCEKRAGNG